MECRRVQDLLADYSVQALHAREHREVERHVEQCEACRTELRALDDVMLLVERYGEREPPPGLFNAVRNRIESGELSRERPAWWAWLYTRPARFAAMGLASAALALGLLMPAGRPAPIPSIAPPVVAEGQDVGMQSTALADSIRQHALSAAEGPLADRVAWEAMAQMATGEPAPDEAPAPSRRDNFPGVE